ncbi:hypothetical protein M758_12G187700 [Ceratodon purpureus]|uniref:Uncharacterized protein n=1 Tax=Ceratodon purpureus TaxID=3225 RepID=A0A8T0G8M2_CERPU|nr:hypothetical protein KC19_12G183900 [Ceratodon purpureus]KAG0599920.1 hypothetical protein M758_12G187700 [Ceratodon purpureus]
MTTINLQLQSRPRSSHLSSFHQSHLPLSSEKKSSIQANQKRALGDASFSVIGHNQINDAVAIPQPYRNAHATNSDSALAALT